MPAFEYRALDSGGANKKGTGCYLSCERLNLGLERRLVHVIAHVLVGVGTWRFAGMQGQHLT